MDANPPLRILESTAFKLNRATVLIDRIADGYLRENHGIRYAPFLVIMMVGILGAPTQRVIADNLGVSRASVTQRVGALVADGHLATAPDPDDARANRVSLTAQGAALLDRAWRGLENHQDGLDAGVDEPALVAQLDRLIANAVAVLAARETGANP